MISFMGGGSNMKKRIIKIVTAWALVLCMTFPTIMSVHAEADVVGDAIQKETFMVQHHSAIDSYRGTDFRAPESPDAKYLFAGWYQDEDCKTALEATDKTGEAYAKFVYKDVLGVKAQLVSGTNFSTEVADIRFVSTVDSLNYQEVGFDFVIYGRDIPYTSDKVYHTLYAINNAGTVLEEYTPDLFHKSSSYFFACTVQSVNNTSFDSEIQATPYWITLDGTKVSATTVTKSISDGYIPKAMDASATLECEISSADYTLQGGTVRSKYYYLVSAGTEETKISRLARDNDANVWNTTPSAENILSTSNVKDIAYNMTEKLLVMVSGSDSERTITLIDRNNLTETTSTNITTTTVPLAIESMEHNMNHNKYVVMLADGSLKVLNADFTETSVITTVQEDFMGYTAQSVTADDSYLYQAFSKNENDTISNVIAVYDWDGTYVTKIDTTLADCEITNIDIVDNTIYVACATDTGIKIYNIDILRTFDIAYVMDGGTNAPTNPSGYTVNSDTITLSDPTKEGYEFMGWEEKYMFSLSEVQWNKGFVVEANGNTPVTENPTWPNAWYSEPIYLATGAKYTLIGENLPVHRWRMFEDDTLENGATRTEDYVEVTDHPYAVLVFETALSDEQKDSLKIQVETLHPTLSYSDENNKTQKIELDNWTKGFIDTSKPWSESVLHGNEITTSGWENAVYSQLIEVKAGVTYTLSKMIDTERRVRFIPVDDTENVVNLNISNSKFTPTEDGTVCVLAKSVKISMKNWKDEITIESGSIGDRMYTANWVRNSFKVQYDANGGSGSMEDSIHVFGTESSLAENTYTKEGYGFTGWNTAMDGTGTAYAAGQTIQDLTLDESITLYAQWSPLYTIEYAYGEGAIAPEIENPTSYTIKSESFTLNQPTRPGYTFTSWKETIILENTWHSGEVAQSDGKIKEHSTYYHSDLIYLQKGRNYKLNIGIPASNMRWRLYNSDETYWMSQTITDKFNPTTSSYYVRFMTVPASTEEVRNAATVTSSAPSITIDKGTTANRKYEAVWQANSYTVEYNGNGAEGTMESSSHVYGTEKKLDANTFTRSDGYAFTGWNTEADGTGTTYGNETSVKNLTTEDGGTVTLYAQWTNQDVYTITYDLSGGSLAAGESNPILYAKTTESFTLKTPAMNASAFEKWEETISLKNSWYSGLVNQTTGKIESHSTYYYSDLIYLQKGRTYKLNIGITGSDMRWRLYNLDGTYFGTRTFSSGEFTPNDASYYVRFMTVPASTEEVRNATTVTSSAATITVDKGTTGNRTYKAIWKDEVLP